MTEQRITDQLWEYAKKLKSQALYNWLNRDNINEVWLDGNVFWWELNSPSINSMPDNIYEHIKNFGKSKGYRYVFDI